MYDSVPRPGYEHPARLEYDDEIPLPHSRLTDELTRRNQLDQVRTAAFEASCMGLAKHASINEMLEHTG